MLIEHSSTNHALIRTAVGALRLVAPLSIVYCPTAAVLIGRGYLRSRWLVPVHVWMVLEALTYSCLYLPLKTHIQRDATHPAAPSREEREILFEKIENTLSDADIYLSQWFLNASLHTIRRENVKEFFAWSLMNRNYAELDATEDSELNTYVDRLESRLSLPLREGWGDAHGLRGTMESVPVQYHPLLWYFIVGSIDSLTTYRLYSHGLRLYRQPLTASVMQLPPQVMPHILSQQTTKESRLPYWYREHTSKSKLPILFIHGIGIGLYAYVDFLVSLAQHDTASFEDDGGGQVGIIALQLLSISARICPPALDSKEMKEAIARILRRHEWTDFVLVGHSYGTAVSASMLRDPFYQTRIKGLVLMDPICFMLHLPNVAYNFTRRKPRKANEAVLYYFASQDLMTSHTIARHFFWSEYILWREDIPKGLPTLITLSGIDLLVPVQEVWTHLTGEPLHADGVQGTVDDATRVSHAQSMEVICYGGLDHAGLFASKTTTKDVVLKIKSLVGTRYGVADEAIQQGSHVTRK